jgi:oligopeptide/dipeptide ABC transporter ATP-binding protein
MDEPTTALDVVVQRLILQRVSELKKELGFSILFITHDLSLLVSFADRIAIMYAGKIVEQARGRELYSAPLHPYTSALMQSFPPLHGTRDRLHGIAGYPPSLRQPIKGCPFYERCSQRIEGVCNLIDPPLETISSKHEVACHLYDTRVEKEHINAAAH